MTAKRDRAPADLEVRMFYRAMVFLAFLAVAQGIVNLLSGRSLLTAPTGAVNWPVIALAVPAALVLGAEAWRDWRSETAMRRHLFGDST